MKRGELLLACEDLVKSYNPLVTTVDAHAAEVLGSLTKNADADKMFLKQVFYGCVRYKKPLKIFLLNFYHDNAGKTIRSDYTLYQILAYLAIFRLGELGFDEFRRFINSQEPGKMHVFLDYLWDPKNIQGPIKTEWLTLFDREYIEGSLIGTMEKYTSHVHELCSILYNKAYGAAAEKKKKEEGGASTGMPQVDKKPLTIPRSPKLTRPRPRDVPEPIRIAQESKAKEYPAELLEKTSVAQIAGEGRQRREQQLIKTAGKYVVNDEFQFHQTRSNVEAVRAEVESKREAELKFDSFKAKPAPKYPEENANVKLNVASVLREDALFKKKQEAEASMIKAYESDLRDANEYYRWQTEMRERDDAAKLAQVERRRLEMVQSAQDAIEASFRNKQENKQLANKIKDEATAMNNQREAEEELTMMNYRQLASEVKHIREVAPRLAEKRVFKERVRNRQDLENDVAQRAAEKAEEDQREQEERDDRVRQIRALERVLQKQETGADKFDPTTTVGQGLLEELSLVELKERLSMNRVQLAEKESGKRRDILQSKQGKAEDLKMRISNISRIRDAAAKANRTAHNRRQQTEAQTKLKEQQMRDKGNMHLASKLEDQRKSRRKAAEELVAEEQEIANQRMFMGAAKSMIEEQHFDEQLRGAEREASERQERAKEAARIYEATIKGEDDARKAVKKKNRVDTKRRHANQASQLTTAKHELSLKKKEDMDAKKTAFQTERVASKMLKEFTVDRNLYAHDQSTRVSELGRTLAMSQTCRKTAIYEDRVGNY